MIVLRTPKGWTCPPVVDGQQVEGTFRAHQVPLPERSRRTTATATCSSSGCGRIGPRSCSTSDGAPDEGPREPRSGRRSTDERESRRERRRAAAGPAPARLARLRGRGRGARWYRARSDARARRVATRGDPREPVELPHLRSGRARQQPAAGHPRGHRPRLADPHRRARRSTGARRSRHRGALRAHVPRPARGLPPQRPARRVHLLRGVHPHRRLDVQPARQVARSMQRRAVASTDPQPELPAVVARVAPGPQRQHAPGSRASSTW